MNSELLAEIEQLHKAISDIKSEVINCFGKAPMACNGAIMVSVEKYDKLVDVINLATGELK